MYDNDYEEEITRRWEEEGGKFLLENGIIDPIDTTDIEEVRKFKENVRKSNNKKTFSFVKLKERSDNMMFDNFELEELIKEFNDEEIDEELEKALKILPEKLKEALGEAYKILIEYKPTLEEIPELLSAVQLLGRLATGKPGKKPYPYPYPKKVKKSMDWQGVQDLLFGGHIPADDEEIEKSSRENPFPSITRAIKIKKEAIDEIEEELEDE